MHLFYLEIHCHFQSSSCMHSGGGDVIYLKKLFFENCIHGYSICIITLFPAHTPCLQPLPFPLFTSHSHDFFFNNCDMFTHICWVPSVLLMCVSLYEWPRDWTDSMSLEKPDSLSLSGCQASSFVRFSPSMLECQLASLGRSCVGDHLKISCTTLIIQNVKVI